MLLCSFLLYQEAQVLWISECSWCIGLPGAIRVPAADRPGPQGRLGRGVLCGVHPEEQQQRRDAQPARGSSCPGCCGQSPAEPQAQGDPTSAWHDGVCAMGQIVMQQISWPVGIVHVTLTPTPARMPHKGNDQQTAPPARGCLRYCHASLLITDAKGYASMTGVPCMGRLCWRSCQCSRIF